MSLIAQLDMTFIQNRLTDLLTATNLQAIQTIRPCLYTRTLTDLFQQIDSYIRMSVLISGLRIDEHHFGKAHQDIINIERHHLVLCQGKIRHFVIIHSRENIIVGRIDTRIRIDTILIVCVAHTQGVIHTVVGRSTSYRPFASVIQTSPVETRIAILPESLQQSLLVTYVILARRIVVTLTIQHREILYEFPSRIMIRFITAHRSRTRTILPSSDTVRI